MPNYVRLGAIEAALKACIRALRETAQDAHHATIADAETALRRIPIEVPAPAVPKSGCPFCGRAVRPRREERILRCEHLPCGVPFPTRSPLARYCSASHRIAAMRARKRATHFGAK